MKKHFFLYKRENPMSTSNELLEQFAVFNRLLHRRHAAQCRHFGPSLSAFRGQGRVLAILNMKKAMSQKELGYLLDMRNQSLGEILGKLETAGYITRSPSVDDKRTAVIRLTALGESEAGVEKQAQGEDSFDRLFACLEDGEKENLADYLGRLIAAAKAQLSEAGETNAEAQDHRREGLGRRHRRHGEGRGRRCHEEEQASRG
jgi:DNA-binding MarR family transcriptional regulator